MLVSLILAILVGLTLGLVINVLADRLPAYRARAIDEDDESETVPSLEQDVPQDTEGVEMPHVSPAEDWGFHRLSSLRYVAVEILLIVLTIYIWLGGTSLPLVSALLYISIFTLIALIDIEHRLILTVVILPAFLLAFIELALSGRLTFTDAMVGYAIGQILVMLIYLFSGLFLWLRNIGRSEPIREIAFGFGDVTLATFCGLAVGYPGVIYMIVLAILVGGALALLFLVQMGITRRYEANRVMPYGPAIVIAAAIVLLWGDRVGYYLMGGR